MAKATVLSMPGDMQSLVTIAMSGEEATEVHAALCSVIGITIPHMTISEMAADIPIVIDKLMQEGPR